MVIFQIVTFLLLALLQMILIQEKKGTEIISYQLKLTLGQLVQKMDEEKEEEAGCPLPKEKEGQSLEMEAGGSFEGKS